MKKNFALFLVSILSLPVLASCPVDTDKSCTAGSTDRTETSKPILKEPKEKTDVQDNKISKDYIEVKTYDPDCQFGVCLPKKASEKIKP